MGDAASSSSQAATTEPTGTMGATTSTAAGSDSSGSSGSSGAHGTSDGTAGPDVGDVGRLYGPCSPQEIGGCGGDGVETACASTQEWNVCTYPCESAEECPPEPSGFAVECRDYQMYPSSCVIPCSAADTSCPPSMQCIPNLMRCAWPS